jgi:hypothetical protein
MNTTAKRVGAEFLMGISLLIASQALGDPVTNYVQGDQFNYYGSDGTASRADQYDDAAKKCAVAGLFQCAARNSRMAELERNQSRLFLLAALGMGAAGLAVGVVALANQQNADHNPAPVLLGPSASPPPPTVAPPSAPGISPVPIAAALERALGGPGSAATGVPAGALGAVAGQTGPISPQNLTPAAFAQITGQLVNLQGLSPESLR